MGRPGPELTDAVTTIGVLSEPVRRRLYEHVVSQPEPVDRDRAAAAIGIGRPLAAFHLDRLVAAGLLETEFRRRTGRTGPGAGRPAKFYRPAPTTVELSLPARRYQLAAEILADGFERSRPAGVPAALLKAAHERGRRLGNAVRPIRRRSLNAARVALTTALRATGYEPHEDVADGGLRLRNCPFDGLVDEHRALTCPMNLAMLEGVLAGVGETGLVAEAQPNPGYCCVGFRPR